MNRARLLLLLAMGALFGTFFALDLDHYLSLTQLQAHQARLALWVDRHVVAASLLFLVIYVLTTALSLPGAALLTLAGSAVFGILWGLLLVSFASSLGATLAFLSARFLLRDWVETRFGDKLTSVQAGMQKEGAFYLLSLRLIPLFPFFLVNLVMGLTPIRVSTLLPRPAGRPDPARPDALADACLAAPSRPLPVARPLPQACAL